MEENRVRMIETMEHWRQAEAYLRENGFHLWQTQYAADCPDGFHVWFMKARTSDIEIVTHNPDVQRAIVKFEKG